MTEVPELPTLQEEIQTHAPQATDSERIQALAEALRERFEMDDEDASAIAEVVTDQFEDAEEVNDDTLDPEIRSIFYTLEAKKLLTFRREEYSIETGERRRAFFWRVRDDELDRLGNATMENAEESVYDQLPTSVWNRQNA